MISIHYFLFPVYLKQFKLYFIGLPTLNSVSELASLNFSLGSLRGGPKSRWRAIRSKKKLKFPDIKKARDTSDLKSSMARTASKKAVKRGPKAKRIEAAIREALAKCQEAFDMVQEPSDDEIVEESTTTGNGSTTSEDATTSSVDSTNGATDVATEVAVNATEVAA
jgi:hypothetical protein